MIFLEIAKRSGYRGYVTSRSFGGLTVPVPMQSLALRDYCSRKGYIYKLHLNENIFPHSYMVLEGIAVDTSSFEGILMCSMFMLPTNSVRREAVLQKILQQETPIHFVFEDVVIKSFNDINLIEDSLNAASIIPFCPSVTSKEILDFDS